MLLVIFFKLDKQMNYRYKIALTIYSFQQILFLLYFLLMSLGLKKNSHLSPLHYSLFLFIILNISILIYFPYQKKIKNLRKTLQTIAILFLTFNFIFTLKYLNEILFFGMDGGFFTIISIILFSVSDLYLGKQILIKN